MVLALVICGPVLAQPTVLALGHEGNDVWNHVWGYWWVAEELSNARLPVRTDHLAWPYGGSLWFIDTLNAVLMLPVELIAGPVAAYNAAFFFNFFLCGVGAYAFTLHDPEPGGGCGGGCGLHGHSSPSGAGLQRNQRDLLGRLAPLALLAMRLTIRRPTRNAVFAGVLTGINALASWYYGLFAGFFWWP